MENILTEEAGCQNIIGYFGKNHFGSLFIDCHLLWTVFLFYLGINRNYVKRLFLPWMTFTLKMKI